MKIISQAKFKKLIPKRLKTSNKTNYGHSIIIGGSEKYLGAAILSALACTRTGSGYTHLMSDLKKYPWFQYPDFILHSFNLIDLKNFQNYSIGIGPGLGKTTIKLKILKYLIKNKFPHVLLDADGLSLLTKLGNISLPSSWILTPHEGELSKLLGVTSKLVSKDRIKYAYEVQKKYKCNILLKGFETILIDSELNLFQMKIGTPALAKAGTGDVLSGIITSLIAQKLSPMNAMKLGVYIHSSAATNFLDNGNDVASLRPTDLIENISIVLKRLR